MQLFLDLTLINMLLRRAVLQTGGVSFLTLAMLLTTYLDDTSSSTSTNTRSEDGVIGRKSGCKGKHRSQCPPVHLLPTTQALPFHPPQFPAVVVVVVIGQSSFGVLKECLRSTSKHTFYAQLYRGGLTDDASRGLCTTSVVVGGFQVQLGVIRTARSLWTGTI